MIIVRFRNKEEHKKLLQQVREMKDSLNDIEDCISNFETEPEYRKRYDDDDYKSNRSRYNYRYDRDEY